MSGIDLTEAIREASDHLHADSCPDEDMHGCRCDQYDREAEIAIRAALPHLEQQLRAQIAAKALREAADQLDAYSDGDVPDDPRWTCDLGYYGEAAWLRARADDLEAGQSCMTDDLTTRRIEAAARARFDHAAKRDGAWELLSPPQRAFHLAGMRAALAAMEAVR